VGDGNHVEEGGLHRHSITAARQHAVRSPLIEAGMTHGDVTRAIRALGLPVRGRPVKSCLSSRVRQGVPITPELLHDIEAAERDVASASHVELRVRGHEFAALHPSV
jgi:uncharacterized protein